VIASGIIASTPVTLARFRSACHALFRAGKIDSIPENVLEAAAAKKYAEFPKVSGRVARDEKGVWAGSAGKRRSLASTTSCSPLCVELGLQVPGHDQPRCRTSRITKRRPRPH